MCDIIADVSVIRGFKSENQAWRETEHVQPYRIQKQGNCILLKLQQKYIIRIQTHQKNKQTKKAGLFKGLQF